MFESRFGRIVPAAVLCVVLFVPCLALAQDLDEGITPRWGNDDPVNIRQEVTQLFQQGLFLYQHGIFLKRSRLRNGR